MYSGFACHPRSFGVTTRNRAFAKLVIYMKHSTKCNPLQTRESRNNISKRAPMNKQEIMNKIEYVICCVGAFAAKYSLSNEQAYAYLRRFSGIDFLIDCYSAEHTLSIDEAVEDIQAICFQKGGRIA